MNKFPSDNCYFLYKNNDKFISYKFDAGGVCVCVCWWRAVLRKMELKIDPAKKGQRELRM